MKTRILLRRGKFICQYKSWLGYWAAFQEGYAGYDVERNSLKEAEQYLKEVNEPWPEEKVIKEYN